MLGKILLTVLIIANLPYLSYALIINGLNLDMKLSNVIKVFNIPYSITNYNPNTIYITTNGKKNAVVYESIITNNINIKRINYIDNAKNTIYELYFDRDTLFLINAFFKDKRDILPLKDSILKSLGRYKKIRVYNTRNEAMHAYGYTNNNYIFFWRSGICNVNMSYLTNILLPTLNLKRFYPFPFRVPIITNIIMIKATNQ